MRKPTYTKENFRDVWELLSKDPSISINRIAEAAGLTRGQTIDIINRMRRIGLVDQEWGSQIKTVNVTMTGRTE